jgi:hypothetical protein
LFSFPVRLEREAVHLREDFEHLLVGDPAASLFVANFVHLIMRIVGTARSLRKRSVCYIFNILVRVWCY